MKAYLLRQTRALAPFLRPASSLRLFRCTVRSRLRTQLERAGCTVVELDHDMDALDSATLEPGSLVVQDDVLLSDSFLKHFLRVLPERQRNYSCEVDSARFAALNERAPSASFRSVAIRYYGAPAARTTELLRLTPTTVFATRAGLPANLHTATDLCLHLLDFYALQLGQWFDFMTASALYAREYSAAVIHFLQRFLPAFVLRWLLRPARSGSRTNMIGKNCRIHATALLEGCVLGDNVEIGPFCRLRCAVIGDDVVIREHSSVSLSFVGEGSYVMGGDIVSSYIGAKSAILTRMLYHLVFGERSFIGGGSGFADFTAFGAEITACIGGQQIASGLRYLGSAVGDDCFIGSNLTFSPGRTIYDGMRILDHNVIKDVPDAAGGVFVRSGAQLLQIPEGFLQAAALVQDAPLPGGEGVRSDRAVVRA
jgi:acetyltransferase-like isoleucine patch superfamily enzyme